jgi:TM2 domain-containing membrane protein YozV
MKFWLCQNFIEKKTSLPKTFFHHGWWHKTREKNMRSRTLASLLALFGGFFGLHYFYLGKTGLGIMSVVFMFTGVLSWVPPLLGVVNFFILLGMSDEEFDKRYNREQWRDKKRQRYQGENFEDPRQEAIRRNEEARRRMNPTPVRDKPREVVQRPASSQKEPLKESGLKKYREFDYDGAIEDFGKALAIDNKDVAVHWNLCCLYSLTEQKELAFYHLQKAVELGFKDYDKIKSHEALAHLRVQPDFDEFSRSGFKMTESMEHSDILQQLRKLAEQREKGLLSEKEFAEMTRRIAS